MNVQNSFANLHFQDGKNHDFKRNKKLLFSIYHTCASGKLKNILLINH
jgi:hypothetical protein